VTNRGVGPCVRVLRSRLTNALEEGAADFAQALRSTRDMYITGALDSGLASAGESAALIDEIQTCQQIVDSTIQSSARPSSD
jgi:NADH:quinone reductase (non-electrogenic)